MEIQSFQQKQTLSVVSLWETCGLVHPQNDPYEDIKRKLKVQPELFLVGVKNKKIIATVMAGYDGHRGWLYYLAVAPDYQKSGVGQKMVLAAEKRLITMGCPKINIQVRSSNSVVIDFYRKIDFVEDMVLSMGKKLQGTR